MGVDNNWQLVKSILVNCNKPLDYKAARQFDLIYEWHGCPMYPMYSRNHGLFLNSPKSAREDSSNTLIILIAVFVSLLCVTYYLEHTHMRLLN